MTTVSISMLPLVESFKEGNACLLQNQLVNLLEKQLLSNQPLSSEERRTLGEFNFAFEWTEVPTVTVDLETQIYQTSTITVDSFEELRQITNSDDQHEELLELVNQEHIQTEYDPEWNVVDGWTPSIFVSNLQLRPEFATE